MGEEERKAGPGDEGPSRRLTFEAGEGSEEFLDRLQAHYRECRRKDVDAVAQLRVLVEGGREFDRGTARVRNVSATGALLVDVRLEKGGYPTVPFSLEIRLGGGAYSGIGFTGTPVRFAAEEGGIGVKFDEIFVSAFRRPAGEAG
jgi:hypothetical protein